MCHALYQKLQAWSFLRTNYGKTVSYETLHMFRWQPCLRKLHGMYFLNFKKLQNMYFPRILTYEIKLVYTRKPSSVLRLTAFARPFFQYIWLLYITSMRNYSVKYMLKQTISLQKGCLLQILLGPLLNTLSHMYIL